MGLNGQIVNQVRHIIDAAGRIIGYRNPVTDADEASLTASQVAAVVNGLAIRTEPVQRPYRIASFGDSRASFMSTSTLLVPTGSATALNRNRAAPWLAAYLGDAELVASFGHGGDTAVLWASSSRANSKTINNLIAANVFKGGPVDVVYVQYGINDYIAGTSAATVAAAIQALCGALMGAGFKVVLESTNPASAAVYGASAAAKLQATIDGNALLATWAAGYPGHLAYVDTFSTFVDGTGYASATYIADGTHHNWLGAMASGAACATAARTMLPQKTGMVYSCGSKLTPALIGWGDPPLMYFVSDVATVTGTTPTWNIDATTGLPYAEVTMTCTALTSGRALGHLEVHPAAGVISGATPRWPLAIGDELQGSAYITVDDGTGGQPAVQSVVLRHRAYFDSKFADDGQFIGAAGSLMVRSPSGRYTTPTFFTATASGAIAAPAAGAGYCLQAHVEFNAVNQVARVRVYAPSLRVVSAGLQPTQPTAGASPYTYTNTTGAPVTMYVAGGTVSAITIARQGAALTTGFTSGAFRLAQNDAVTVTYSVIPTITVVPEESS